MQLLQKNRCFEGEQRIYQIDSQHLKGLSKVGVYLPPEAQSSFFLMMLPFNNKFLLCHTV